MVIEVRGNAIEILLEKCALGTNHFVSRQAARRYQHDENAILWKKEESQMLHYAARKGRRNKNAQAARNCREHMARPLHHSFRSLRGFELAPYPQTHPPGSR